MATTDTQRQTFLDEYERTGIIADACKLAGVCYATYRRWMDDPQFAEAFRDAHETAADVLESEARRRAIEGVVRKRFDKEGNLISEEVVYSDGLLTFLLKGNKPEKFADRSKTELSSPDGSMSPAAGDTQAAARIAALLEEAKRRREADSDPLFE